MELVIISEKIDNLLLYSCIAGLFVLSAILYYLFGPLRKKLLQQRTEALLLEEDFIP